MNSINERKKCATLVDGEKLLTIRSLCGTDILTKYKSHHTVRDVLYTLNNVVKYLPYGTYMNDVPICLKKNGLICNEHVKICDLVDLADFIDLGYDKCCLNIGIDWDKRNKQKAKKLLAIKKKTLIDFTDKKSLKFIDRMKKFNPIKNPDISSEVREWAKNNTHLKINEDSSIVSIMKAYDERSAIPRTIYVKSLVGKTTKFKVPQDISCVEIKMAICNVECIPIDQQRLIVAQVELEDNKFLSDYTNGKFDELKVYLILKLRGGMYAEVSGRDGEYKSLRDMKFELISIVDHVSIIEDGTIE